MATLDSREDQSHAFARPPFVILGRGGDERREPLARGRTNTRPGPLVSRSEPRAGGCWGGLGAGRARTSAAEARRTRRAESKVDMYGTDGTVLCTHGFYYPFILFLPESLAALGGPARSRGREEEEVETRHRRRSQQQQATRARPKLGLPPDQCARGVDLSARLAHRSAGGLETGQAKRLAWDVLPRWLRTNTGGGRLVVD
ncbi:hypothetical protein CDD83_1117 [Cordyceps sp. RAO-2017]|nr:hypothetical protein CDD83_1117 [Cordyceps sp. RAO-2017]